MRNFDLFPRENGVKNTENPIIFKGGTILDTIFVTGHRNPDTDSIVAAMAYAALRNAVGDREYEAACLGHVSDETKTVLERFGFQAPQRITSMHTQVCDLEFDRPPVFSKAVTIMSTNTLTIILTIT